MQLLNKYIEKNFKSNKAAFARHMNVSSQQITRWINEDWVVEDSKLYSPRRDVPPFAIARNEFHSDQNFPLHHEDNARPVHRKSLILDIDTGEIFVDYAFGLEDIFFKRKLTFRLSKTLTASEIATCIDEHIDIFQAILTGSRVIYDGKNFVGQINSDAEKWISLLDDTLSTIESSEDWYILEDLNTYLEADPFGCKYGAKGLSDVESYIREKIKNSPSEMLSDDLNNNFEGAIRDFYHYFLSECYSSDEMSVPDWVFELEEFSYFKDTE
jgi:hypothetical protein